MFLSRWQRIAVGLQDFSPTLGGMAIKDFCFLKQKLTTTTACRATTADRILLSS